MAVRTNHVDEKLPLYATEAMSPSRLHQLKAAAVGLAVSLSAPWLPEIVAMSHWVHSPFLEYGP